MRQAAAAAGFARFAGAILALSTTLLLGQCVSIATVESGTAFASATSDQKASGPRDGAAIEPGHVSAVVLRFTAWGNHQRYTPALRERLRLRGYRLRASAADTLEVVLEESGTTPELLRLLNGLTALATGTLVPFYNQVNYRLTYRHFRDGVLQNACRYELRNNEFLSVLAIPLAPFYWSTGVLAETLEATVDAYAYGCLELESLTETP